MLWQRRSSVVRACLAWLVWVALSTATAAGAQITTERVVTGLSRPLFATAAPGDSQRLFIVEQGMTGRPGQIRIFNFATNSLNAAPFLTVSNISNDNEQGLLGLAFHPNYAQNGQFYVNYTDSTGTTRVERYQVSDNPDVANAASATSVLRIAQPFTNHNGGWLGFGPNDGYLYIATGDGGSGNDPGNRAQTISNQLLGKMLRIDVDGDDFPTDSNKNYAVPATNPFVGQTGDDEIWAYGLRNPWRNGFDRLTGDLYIGDVGQTAREEIDFQPASSAGGENYGWRAREGKIDNPNVPDPAPAGAIDPIYDYPRSNGFSVTGGYVYRGESIPELNGTYFFGDYGSARIWSFRYDGQTMTEFQERTSELAPDVGSITQITSFGEDAAGELYIVSRGGSIFKFVPVPLPLGDMNGDRQVDNLDIAPFALALTNPSEFEEQFPLVDAGVVGDVNVDGQFDNLDISGFTELLTSPGVAPVPEPATNSLIVCGAILLAASSAFRRRTAR